MATEKLFTVAGITELNGTVKVRFANDLISRIKIFSKAGAQVRLIELPNPMSKLEALQYLSTHAEYQDREASFVIQSKLQEKSKVVKRGEVKVAGTKAKKVSQPQPAKETV